MVPNKPQKRWVAKASLQLEVEEVYSPPSSPGWVLLDLQSNVKPVWNCGAKKRRPLKLTAGSITRPTHRL